MSELAQIQKALEESQTKLQGLFDEQKKQIEQNGTISKQLQDDITKVNEEMTKTGQRLFDLEQRLSSGPENPGEKKSFSERAAEELVKSWNGSKGNFEASTFNKSLGSGAASAGSLIQPMQVPGIIMPGLRRLTIRDLLAQGRISSNSLEYVRENVFYQQCCKRGGKSAQARIRHHIHQADCQR